MRSPTAIILALPLALANVGAPTQPQPTAPAGTPTKKGDAEDNPVWGVPDRDEKHAMELDLACASYKDYDWLSIKKKFWIFLEEHRKHLPLKEWESEEGLARMALGGSLTLEDRGAGSDTDTGSSTKTHSDKNAGYPAVLGWKERWEDGRRTQGGAAVSLNTSSGSSADPSAASENNENRYQDVARELVYLAQTKPKSDCYIGMFTLGIFTLLWMAPRDRISAIENSDFYSGPFDRAIPLTYWDTLAAGWPVFSVLELLSIQTQNDLFGGWIPRLGDGRLFAPDKSEPQTPGSDASNGKPGLGNASRAGNIETVTSIPPKADSPAFTYASDPTLDPAQSLPNNQHPALKAAIKRLSAIIPDTSPCCEVISRDGDATKDWTKPPTKFVDDQVKRRFHWFRRRYVPGFEGSGEDVGDGNSHSGPASIPNLGNLEPVSNAISILGSKNGKYEKYARAASYLVIVEKLFEEMGRIRLEESAKDWENQNDNLQNDNMQSQNADGASANRRRKTTETGSQRDLAKPTSLRPIPRPFNPPPCEITAFEARRSFERDLFLRNKRYRYLVTEGRHLLLLAQMELEWDSHSFFGKALGNENAHSTLYELGLASTDSWPIFGVLRSIEQKQLITANYSKLLSEGHFRIQGLMGGSGNGGSGQGSNGKLDLESGNEYAHGDADMSSAGTTVGSDSSRSRDKREEKVNRVLSGIMDEGEEVGDLGEVENGGIGLGSEDTGGIGSASGTTKSASNIESINSSSIERSDAVKVESDSSKATKPGESGPPIHIAMASDLSAVAGSIASINSILQNSSGLRKITIHFFLTAKEVENFAKALLCSFRGDVVAARVNSSTGAHNNTQTSVGSRSPIEGSRSFLIHRRSTKEASSDAQNYPLELKLQVFDADRDIQKVWRITQSKLWKADTGNLGAAHNYVRFILAEWFAERGQAKQDSLDDAPEIPSEYRSETPSHEVSKLIYLDVDIIVQCDVAELYDAFPDESLKVLGAVMRPTNVANFVHIWDQQKLSRWYPGFSSASFNAGVTVFNLKQWRRLNFSDKLAKLFAEVAISSELNHEKALAEKVFGGMRIFSDRSIFSEKQRRIATRGWEEEEKGEGTKKQQKYARSGEGATISTQTNTQTKGQANAQANTRGETSLGAESSDSGLMTMRSDRAWAHGSQPPMLLLATDSQTGLTNHDAIHDTIHETNDRKSNTETNDGKRNTESSENSASSLIHWLPPAFNVDGLGHDCQASWYERWTCRDKLRRTVLAGKILHWTGPAKPWGKKGIVNLGMDERRSLGEERGTSDEKTRTSMEKDHLGDAGEMEVERRKSETEVISTDTLFYRNTYWKPYDRFCF